MSDLSARLAAARARAHQGGLPVRRKDGRLYAVLAECLSIAEDVIRHGQITELREALRVSVNVRGHGNAGRGRRYAEAGSDAFVLVARAVLEGVDNRNSVYRYAATLREAARRGIAACDLAEWLARNGGVNSLFRRRPVVARTMSTRTLHLNAPVEVPKGRPFTITLQGDGRGFFDVLDVFGDMTVREAAE